MTQFKPHYLIATAALALGLFATSVRAEEVATFEIRELETYRHVLGRLPRGEGVWYIFDLDNTTMRPDGETLIGSHQWQDHVMEMLMAKRGLSRKEANDKAAFLLTFVQKHVGLRLTEKEILKVFDEIDAGRSPRFALTARLERSRRATNDQFRQVGVEFAGRAPLAANGESLLPDGLAMAEDKGALLTEMLRNAKIRPKKIVMFDDRPYNLENIQKALETWNAASTEQISFIGFRYANSDESFAELRADPRKSKIADLQAETFFREKTIVPASEIEKALDASGGGAIDQGVRQALRGQARCERLFR